MSWLQRLIGVDAVSGATDINPLPVGLTTEALQSRFVTIVGEADHGAITGTRLLREPYVSEDFRLTAGSDSQMATYNFTAATQNTGDFRYQALTMSANQSGGFLNVNANLATVSGNYAFYQTKRFFSLNGSTGLFASIIGQISAAVPTNQIQEAGFFQGTTGTAPVDGAFFRVTPAGVMGVITYNGVETQTANFITVLPINVNAMYSIIVTQRTVSFWVDNVLGGKLSTPAGNALPFQWINLPMTHQVRNIGTVVGGSTFRIGSANVIQTDLTTYMPLSHQVACQGAAYQGQDGDVQGGNALWGNNIAPTAMALTNTTAAFSGLGGITAVLPTLAVNSDGILINFTNPVPTITQPAKTFVFTGVSLQGAVSVVLTGGPVTYMAAVAFGHTAVSLATVETGSFVSPSAKAPRIVPIGIHTFPVTAAVGTASGLIDIDFTDGPIVIHPGENISIVLRNIGVVTTLGAITFSATLKQYIF